MEHVKRSRFCRKSRHFQPSERVEIFEPAQPESSEEAPRAGASRPDLDLSSRTRSYSRTGRHACAGRSGAAVHYAHAGSGELHLRPILNLKEEEHRRLFRVIATEIAHLVKRCGGSLSGEHGDGRLRGEFLPFMVGKKNYALFREIKKQWDPTGLFNPGKITDTPPMDASLRYEPGQALREIPTVLNFADSRGILRPAEQCNGSGDCRKSHLMGGTMCPSYMATRNERDTTRARANILREVLTRSPKSNPFDSEEVAAVMDLCLSCKGCKSECPSNVDVARLKAEWLQQYYDARGVPFRSKLIAGFSSAMAAAQIAPGIYNFLVTNRVTSRLFKRLAGFAPERSLPRLYAATLRRWHQNHANKEGLFPNGRVFLFCDEFTNFNDVGAGRKLVRLLNRLGYEITIPKHVDSGRAQISKGLLRDARRLAIRNVELLKDVVTDDTPMIGIEPSAILGFRDEVPDLVPAELIGAARELSKHSLLVDEFIAREAEGLLCNLRTATSIIRLRWSQTLGNEELDSVRESPYSHRYVLPVLQITRRGNGYRPGPESDVPCGRSAAMVCGRRRATSAKRHRS